MDCKRKHLEEENGSSDIMQSLQILANGIAEIQASLTKPKEKSQILKILIERLILTSKF